MTDTETPIPYRLPLTPAEARRRLEMIPGAGYVLEAEDVAAIRALVADNDKLAGIADRLHAQVEGLGGRGVAGRHAKGSGA